MVESCLFLMQRCTSQASSINLQPSHLCTEICSLNLSVILCTVDDKLFKFYGILPQLVDTNFFPRLVNFNPSLLLRNFDSLRSLFILSDLLPSNLIFFMKY